MQMTPDYIRTVCMSTGGWRQPHLNEQLYLHCRGFAEIQNLDEYVNVKALWLEQNGIREIKNLHPLKELRTLYLHQNAIPEIKGLDGLTHLNTLSLSDNYVRTIPDKATFKDCSATLETLSLANNRIERFSDILGLTALTSLESLDISKNAIEAGGCVADDIPTPPDGWPSALDKQLADAAAEGASPLPVDSAEESESEGEKPAGDAAAGIEGGGDAEGGEGGASAAASAVSPSSASKPSHKPAKGATGALTGRLEGESILRGDPLDAVIKFLRHFPALKIVYLSGNPFVNACRYYRKRLIAALPNLTYIDDKPVFPEEQEDIAAWVKGGIHAEGAVRTARAAAKRRDQLASINAWMKLAESKRPEKEAAEAAWAKERAAARESAAAQRREAAADRAARRAAKRAARLAELSCNGTRPINDADVEAMVSSTDSETARVLAEEVDGLLPEPVRVQALPVEDVVPAHSAQKWWQVKSGDTAAEERRATVSRQAWEEEERVVEAVGRGEEKKAPATGGGGGGGNLVVEDADAIEDDGCVAQGGGDEGPSAAAMAAAKAVVAEAAQQTQKGDVGARAMDALRAAVGLGGDADGAPEGPGAGGPGVTAAATKRSVDEGADIAAYAPPSDQTRRPVNPIWDRYAAWQSRGNAGGHG